MKISMRLIVILTLCAAALSACFTIPKSRTEFSHTPDIQKLVFTTSRSLDSVVASLNKQNKDCEMSTATAGNGFKHQQVIITSKLTINRVSANKAELTYQVSVSNAIGEPEGGNYSFVADFRAIGPRQTEATFYHPAVNQTPLTRRLRKWTEGDVSSCYREMEWG